jgi:hypothetical protein
MSKEKDMDDFDIIMNMLIKKNDKDYLIVVSSNKTRDYAIILIQQSSYIYFRKYLLDDFKKINFFKNYLNFGINQCIEILINLLKEKKELINIEEEENKEIKLYLDLEIGVVGMKLNLPKERIELILLNDNSDFEIKNILIWKSILYLFQEREKEEKLILELENKIKELTKDKYELKQNMDEKKLTNCIVEVSKNKYELNKGNIINEFNEINFEFVKNRLKSINKDKKLNLLMLYSAKINGDKCQKFHQLCDNHHNTLIIIKTDRNNIFGGFAGKTWNSWELGRKKDLKSFLFSLNKKKIYNSKPESKFHLYCSENDGPCFYAFSVENFCLKNGGFCDEVYKCNFDSFENDFELNDGVKKFNISELEVYEVKYV